MIFNAAISGIKAATTDLEVTGNNIANSSTIGFKSSRANFSDIFMQNVYGGSGNTGGLGVQVTSIQQSFASGSIVASASSLDLAIGGSGFFILDDQGAKSYTRAGQFTVDNNNYIVNGSGNRLQGITANKGVLTGASGDLQLNTAFIAPNATTSLTAGMNLLSQSEAPKVNWSGGSAPDVASYNNVTSSTIYDSLGNPHVLSMYFIKSDPNAAASAPNATVPPGDPTTTPPTVGPNNQWYVAFQVDGVDVPAVTPGQANAGNLFRANFNADGSFSGVTDNGNTTDNTNINTIPLSYNFNNGSNPINVAIDFSNSSQYGSPFSVQSVSNDGYTSGSLKDLSIDNLGVISGRYTNGQALILGQVELATFADLNGLQSLGDVSWAATADSGQPLVGLAGTGGLGGIYSGALEESNVDLTGELVNLISAQRNFQANAQTIRTADAVTQAIINIR